MIVGSSNAATVVLAVGARGRGRGGGVVYRICEAAARYGASAERETTDAREAYRKAYERLPRSKWIPYRDAWLPDAGRAPARTPFATVSGRSGSVLHDRGDLINH